MSVSDDLVEDLARGAGRSEFLVDGELEASERYGYDDLPVTAFVAGAEWSLSRTRLSRRERERLEPLLPKGVSLAQAQRVLREVLRLRSEESDEA